MSSFELIHKHLGRWEQVSSTSWESAGSNKHSFHYCVPHLTCTPWPTRGQQAQLCFLELPLISEYAGLLRSQLCCWLLSDFEQDALRLSFFKKELKSCLYSVSTDDLKIYWQGYYSVASSVQCKGIRQKWWIIIWFIYFATPIFTALLFPHFCVSYHQKCIPNKPGSSRTHPFFEN